MIRLTRLGGDAFLLNAELVKYVESLPDTYVTLTSGDRLVVSETPDEVLRRVIEYQRSKHLLPPPHGGREAATYP
ncbi:MAG: flagellar FlbD family protein [Lacipirellulaceae bacterium]